jgi:segregation and condensation protein B
MPLPSLLESILFFKGEPLSLKKLSEITEHPISQIEDALLALETSLQHRGIVLLRKDGEVMLGTHKEAAPLIQKFIKEELHKDLGRAGLETLSIVLYLGPISRSEIDYIRGVNSNFILRNLLMRGLVERIEHESDKRSLKYRPTFELLAFLGITSVEELPEYETMKKDLETRQETSKKEAPTEPMAD